MGSSACTERPNCLCDADLDGKNFFSTRSFRPERLLEWLLACRECVTLEEAVPFRLDKDRKVLPYEQVVQLMRDAETNVGIEKGALRYNPKTGVFSLLLTAHLQLKEKRLSLG